MAGYGALGMPGAAHSAHAAVRAGAAKRAPHRGRQVEPLGTRLVLPLRLGHGGRACTLCACRGRQRARRRRRAGAGRRQLGPTERRNHRGASCALRGGMAVSQSLNAGQLRSLRRASAIAALPLPAQQLQGLAGTPGTRPWHAPRCPRPCDLRRHRQARTPCAGAGCSATPPPWVGALAEPALAVLATYCCWPGLHGAGPVLARVHARQAALRLQPWRRRCQRNSKSCIVLHSWSCSHSLRIRSRQRRDVSSRTAHAAATGLTTAPAATWRMRAPREVK